MNLTPAPEPLQPLLFAPGALLDCGLRDAHHNPLIGVRTDGGVRSFRTSPARAWAYPLVEWSRTGNSYAAIGFDCDTREAVERAAASCMGAGDLPTPNVYATRTASGHAQVFYLLDRPVHRGEHARVKPLQYLARVSEFYRATFGADAGYTGVLSSNPTHTDYATSYPRAEPYALNDLAAAIPRGWRVPRPSTTAEGRNVELFLALCKLSLGGSDDGLLTWARMLNRDFGIVKLRLTAVSDPQHGGFTAGSSPVSCGSIDELFVNLTVPLQRLHHFTVGRVEPRQRFHRLAGQARVEPLQRLHHFTVGRVELRHHSHPILLFWIILRPSPLNSNITSFMLRIIGWGKASRCRHVRASTVGRRARAVTGGRAVPYKSGSIAWDRHPSA